MNQMLEPKYLTLNTLRTGTFAVVRRLQGTISFTSRLAALGLSVGTDLEILQNRGRGPLLIRVRGTRIALGRGEAFKILVEMRADLPEKCHASH